MLGVISWYITLQVGFCCSNRFQRLRFPVNKLEADNSYCDILISMSISISIFWYRFLKIMNQCMHYWVTTADTSFPIHHLVPTCDFFWSSSTLCVSFAMEPYKCFTSWEPKQDFNSAHRNGQQDTYTSSAAQGGGGSFFILGKLHERFVVVNHGWQNESTDGPKGRWSYVFWTGCNSCSGHLTTTAGCSVV